MINITKGKLNCMLYEMLGWTGCIYNGLQMFLPVGDSKMIESLLQSGERTAIKISFIETRSKIVAVLIFDQLWNFLVFLFSSVVLCLMTKTNHLFWGGEVEQTQYKGKKCPLTNTNVK